MKIARKYRAQLDLHSLRITIYIVHLRCHVERTITSSRHVKERALNCVIQFLHIGIGIFKNETYYIISLRRFSRLEDYSVVLASSANDDDDDDPFLSNDAIVSTEQDSGGFDYDIVRQIGANVRRNFVCLRYIHIVR